MSKYLAESLPRELNDLVKRVFPEVTGSFRVAVAKRLVVKRLPIFIDLALLPSMTEATDVNSPHFWLYVLESLVPNGEKIYERIILVDGDQAGSAA